VIRAPVTFFRCSYLCDACPNEWEDEVVSPGESYCPSCDAVCEPYFTEEVVEERAVFEVESAARSYSSLWPVGWREVEA
jgi:hypothetical protein